MGGGLHRGRRLVHLHALHEASPDRSASRHRGAGAARAAGSTRRDVWRVAEADAETTAAPSDMEVGNYRAARSEAEGASGARRRGVEEASRAAWSSAVRVERDALHTRPRIHADEYAAASQWHSAMPSMQCRENAAALPTRSRRSQYPATRAPPSPAEEREREATSGLRLFE